MVTWHRPAFAPAHGTIGGGALPGRMTAAGHSSAAGAMPVRFAIPKRGRRLDYARYWMEAGKPVSLKFSYIRSWLNTPAMLCLAALIALGLFTALANTSSRKKMSVGTIVFIISAACGYRLYGMKTVLWGIVFGAIGAGVYKSRLNSAVTWMIDLKERYPRREKEKKPGGFKRGAGRLILYAGFAIFGLILLFNIFALLELLVHRPLGG